MSVIAIFILSELRFFVEIAFKYELCYPVLGNSSNLLYFFILVQLYLSIKIIVCRVKFTDQLYLVAVDSFTS